MKSNTSHENVSATKGLQAFWWAMLGFVSFGFLSMLAYNIAIPVAQKPKVLVDDAARRDQIRSVVDREQSALMASLNMNFARMAGELDSEARKTTKPAVGTKAHAKALEEMMKASQEKADEAEKADASNEGEGKTDDEKFSPDVSQEIGVAPGFQFAIKEFNVSGGQKLALTFKNDDTIPQMHNLVLCKPGSLAKVQQMAMQIMADPKGMEKQYIPDTDEAKEVIIAHTKLVNQGASETIEITVPNEKGEYVYICTFPGHAMMMHGKMIVE